MKNFKLLIEGILLEASGKYYQGLWQDIFFKKHGIKDYKSATNKQKEELKNYIDEQQKFIDLKLKEFEKDSTAQSWIANVFISGRQKYPEDMDKIIKMIQDFNNFKLDTGLLTKEESNIQNHNFDQLVKLLSDKTKEKFPNYGNNKIIYDKENWKIIKLQDYEDSKELIDNNKNSWCIKFEDNFNETYDPPYYAFYKNDKPYALYNYSPKKHSKPLQLKDSNDNRFKKIDDDFEKPISWLLLKHLVVRDLLEISDLQCLLDYDFEKYYIIFDYDELLNQLRQEEKIKHFYKILGWRKNDYTKIGQFHTAIINSDVTTVKKYLDQKYLYTKDKHFSDLSDWFKAIHIGNIEIIQLFIDAGVDINKQAESWHGSTALMIACENNHGEVVDLLLNHKHLDINKQNKQGNTALFFSIKYPEILKKLLSQPKITINLYNKSSKTALIEACQNGYEEGVILLLKDPITDVNCKNNIHTPLVEACEQRNVKIVKELLKRSDIDVNLQDGNNVYPLKMAIVKEHDNIGIELLKHPNIDVNIYPHFQSKPILFLSYIYKTFKTMYAILNHPNIDINIKYKANNRNLLLYVLSENDDETAFKLLDYKGWEINHKDIHDQSALLYAITHGNFNLIKKILDYPKVDVNIKDNLRITPLILAAQYSQKHIMKLLLDHPAIKVNEINTFGGSALTYAVFNNSYEIVKMLLEKPELDVNIKTMDKQTPLSIAKEKKFKEIEDILLKHGAKE